MILHGYSMLAERQITEIYRDIEINPSITYRLDNGNWYNENFTSIYEMNQRYADIADTDDYPLILK